MLKKTLFFVLAGLALSGSVFAQDGQDSQNSKFYYFTKKGSPTDLRDSAYFTRILTPDPANSKQFILEDIYASGKTRMKGMSLTPGPFFRGQGDFKRYYPDGQLQETETYENGKLMGLRIAYHPNGKVQDSAFYTENIVSGKRVTYYQNGNKEFIGMYDNKGMPSNVAHFFPNGKPYYTAIYDTAKKLNVIGDAYELAGNQTARNGTGIWIDYADTFKRVFAKGTIINGLKDGEWKGKLKDTSNTFLCVYDKGTLVTGTTYLGATGKTVQFTKEEVEPMYKGGFELFYKRLAANTKYPKKAKENDIQGKVFLSFVVDKEGNLVDIKVFRGIGGGCDEAAVEALKKTSEPWTPGTQYGLPVRVQYSIPLNFYLKGG